jgi:diguanylate cyclase (GGDEF)-like protein/PAS domain S-box-containing protein
MDEGIAEEMRDTPSLEHLFLEDERMRVFNDTVPAGILVVAVDDGRVVFSNRFFNEVLGFRGTEILGSGWRDFFVDPGDRERLIHRFIEEGEVRNFALQLRSHDGEHIWGLASLAEIPLESEDLLLFAFVDITALKRAEEEIRRLANHDALTGLISLRRFKDILGEALARARRDGCGFAVLFIDLDYFKAVNDTQGHDAGDQVLKDVGRRLVSSVRETDAVARVGGDEFAVLAERAGASLALGIAERVVAAVRQPFDLPGGTAHIGASIGIALYPQHGANLDSLMKAADRAMYAIKHTTKGAIAIAQPLDDDLAGDGDGV